MVVRYVLNLPWDPRCGCGTVAWLRLDPGMQRADSAHFQHREFVGKIEKKRKCIFHARERSHRGICLFQDRVVFFRRQYAVETVGMESRTGEPAPVDMELWTALDLDVNITTQEEGDWPDGGDGALCRCAETLSILSL